MKNIHTILYLFLASLIVALIVLIHQMITQNSRVKNNKYYTNISMIGFCSFLIIIVLAVIINKS